MKQDLKVSEVYLCEEECVDQLSSKLWEVKNW